MDLQSTCHHIAWRSAFHLAARRFKYFSCCMLACKITRGECNNVDPTCFDSGDQQQPEINRHCVHPIE